MSFEQIVDLMSPQVPPVLVESENIEHIRRMVGHFPTHVARYVGFETKLLSNQARSDFALSLSDDGLAWMSRPDSPWSRIRQFCALWRESEESPYLDRNTVWLWHTFGEG